jgi:hypothetical protein
MRVHRGCAYILLVAAVAACSSSSAKVVDYDWSTSSTQLRLAVTSKARTSCEASVPRATPTTLRPDATIDDKLGALDAADAAHTAAVNACQTDLAPKQYASSLTRLRAQAVGTVCKNTRAAKVRVSWLDYGGDRLTEVESCSR